MPYPLPNAYADAPRLAMVAKTLAITTDEANQAFAQYIPRDAVECDMVEQILLTRARLNAATARVLQPDLPPAVAARIDRTINTMTRELRLLTESLERRQNKYTGQLPQQYWRIEPVREVGPWSEENSSSASQPEPAPVPAASPEPAAKPVAMPVSRWTDPPLGAGDALARFASMRITPDQSLNDAWVAAEQATSQPALNRKLRRAQERQRAAA